MYNNNKINEPIKYKTITNFKKYKINNIDYMLRTNKKMEYNIIKEKLSTLQMLTED